MQCAGRKYRGRSGVNDVQSAFDPFQANFDTIKAFRLCGEIPVQLGDLGFETGDAAAKVSDATGKPVQLVVDAP
jgi:hypothetical protein